jgi:hypothetical protein
LAGNINAIRKSLKLGERDKVIAVSALKRTGHEELLTALGSILEEG